MACIIGPAPPQMDEIERETASQGGGINVLDNGVHSAEVSFFA